MQKEDYLSKDFIRAMREKYLSIRRWKELDVQGIAILAIDLQRYFLNSGFHAYLPSSPHLIHKLQKFYAIGREKDVPILFTRHCHQGDILERWWGDEMSCQDESTTLDPRLSPFAAQILEKNTYDAFYATPLEDILKERDVDTLIITGVMTHLCCETTAREAFVRGFNVIFPVDGTVTQNLQLHEGTLRALSHGFAITPTLGDMEIWMQRWE